MIASSKEAFNVCKQDYSRYVKFVFFTMTTLKKANILAETVVAAPY